MSRSRNVSALRKEYTYIMDRAADRCPHTLGQVPPSHPVTSQPSRQGFFSPIRRRKVTQTCLRSQTIPRDSRKSRKAHRSQRSEWPLLQNPHNIPPPPHCGCPNRPHPRGPRMVFPRILPGGTFLTLLLPRRVNICSSQAAAQQPARLRARMNANSRECLMVSVGTEGQDIQQRLSRGLKAGDSGGSSCLAGTCSHSPQLSYPIPDLERKTVGRVPEQEDP